MPRKALAGVKAGFDNVEGNKWYPVSVTGAKTAYTSEQSKNPGLLRLRLEYTIGDGSARQGRKLFDGGNIEGDSAGMTRARLEDIRPDVDWGEFEFPEPDEPQSDLEEALFGSEGYAFVVHKPNASNPSNPFVNVAKFSLDQPEEYEADGAGADDYDEAEVVEEAPAPKARRGRGKAADLPF